MPHLEVAVEDHPWLLAVELSHCTGRVGEQTHAHLSFSAKGNMETGIKRAVVRLSNRRATS